MGHSFPKPWRRGLSRGPSTYWSIANRVSPFAPLRARSSLIPPRRAFRSRLGHSERHQGGSLILSSEDGGRLTICPIERRRWYYRILRQIEFEVRSEEHTSELQ